jgi:hypothetical protein
MTTTQHTETTTALLAALRGTRQAAELTGLLAHHLGRHTSAVDAVRAAQGEAGDAARAAGFPEHLVALARTSVAVLAADLLAQVAA